MKRRRRIDTLPVFLRGQQLNKKAAIMYLGVWLDETTSWSTQVASAAGKVRTRLDWIRRMTGPTWGMLLEAVEKLVSRVIEPAAYFGAEVWQRAAYNERTVGPLEKAMRQACLLLAGTFRTTSYPSDGARSDYISGNCNDTRLPPAPQHPRYRTTTQVGPTNLQRP